MDFFLEIILICPFFSLNPSERMRIRKQLTISIITIAIILFAIGSVASFITANKQNSQTDGFSGSWSLEPAMEVSRNITVPKDGSMLNIVLNATDRIIVQIDRYGETQFLKNESQLKNTFYLTDPGEWNVTFRNETPQPINYTLSYVLTNFYKYTEQSYVWLVFPTFLTGEILLCALLPITFYDNIKRKWNKKIAEIIIVAIMLIFAVGLMPILSLVLGTSVPLSSPTSSSMEPTVSPGDLALVRGVNPKTLSVGDIIVYDQLIQNLSDPTPSKISNPTMHRIDKIIFENNQRFFVTKGDNNPTEDDWFVPKEGVQGKVVFVIPYLGNVVLALSRIDVKIALVSITVVVIALWPNKKKKTPLIGEKK